MQTPCINKQNRDSKQMCACTPTQPGGGGRQGPSCRPAHSVRPPTTRPRLRRTSPTSGLLLAFYLTGCQKNRVVKVAQFGPARAMRNPRTGSTAPPRPSHLARRGLQAALARGLARAAARVRGSAEVPAAQGHPSERVQLIAPRLDPVTHARGARFDRDPTSHRRAGPRGARATGAAHRLPPPPGPRPPPGGSIARRELGKSLCTRIRRGCCL